MTKQQLKDLIKEVLSEVDKSSLHKELIAINDRIKYMRSFTNYGDTISGSHVKDQQEIGKLIKRKEEILKSLKSTNEAEGFRIKPQPKSPLEGAVVSYVDNDGHYHADIILKTKEGREVKGRFEYHRGQFAFESATNEMYSDTSYKTEKGYDAAKSRLKALKDELKHIQDLKNKSDYNDTNDPQARNYHNRRLKEIPKEISAIRQKILGLREMSEVKTITDDWFKQGSFNTYKKPAVEQYEIAGQDGTLKTLEGEQQYKKGYYILTGPKGEKYSMPPEKFKELKDDLGNGKCSPKKIMKVAKLADHDGSVNTSWGAKLDYTAGNDYIVKHGPGDYGVVKKDIFDTTYSKS